MKVCGLTGGVGMGKSTAARFLREQGAQIVDTDELARELVQPGQPALRKIQEQFGNEIVTSSGDLNRGELARIVFGNISARLKLESILHPLIRERWLAQIGTWQQEKHALAIVVIPLLFETQAESHFEKVICVACSSATQRERLLARGWSQEQIRQRNAAQMPIEQKIARGNFVVWTEGDTEICAKQLKRIFAAL